MTHSSVHYGDLENELKRFLTQQFARIEIVSVTIDSDFEVDGERVLEMSVVFRGTPQDFVDDRPMAFNSNLQNELSVLDAAAFPVVNFIPCAAH